MKKIFIPLFIFIMFIFIDSVSADVITPSNSRIQIETLNGSSSIWNISNGVNSAFNPFYLNTSFDFSVKPRRIYYVANLSVDTSHFYHVAFLFRFKYNYDIYNSFYWTVDNSNYTINVFNDGGILKSSSCSISRRTILKNDDGTYTVDYDVNCDFSVNSNVNDAWFSIGWSGQNLDFNSINGVVPSTNDSYVQLLWYEFTSTLDSNQVIIGQNSTIIDQNNQTNQNLEDINDSIGDLNSNITNSDSSGASSEAGDFFSGFNTDTFGLTSIITSPLNLIGSITSSSCSPLGLPLPYVNKSLTLPCMSSIYQKHFGSFLSLYQTITFGIVAYWVCVRIFNLVKDFKNPEHDQIEVLDL